MKRVILFFCVPVLVLISQSCTQDVHLFPKESMNVNVPTEHVATKSSQSFEEIELEAYDIVEAGFVQMINNRYVIQLSKSEAIDMGYSVEAYELLAYHLELGNDMIAKLIKEWELDPTISSYSIFDFTGKDVEISDTAYSLKSRSESIALPSGVLRSSGQEVVETRTYFPHEATHILADCICNVAPLGVNNVYTKVMDTVYSGSCVYRGTFSVNIAASGTNVTVAYQTTDSNGGTCSWIAQGGTIQ